MRMAILTALLAACLAAGEVLIYDDFEDGQADGWLEYPSGASYTIVNGRYTFTHTAPDTAFAASVTGDQYGSMSVSDYSLRVNTILESGDWLGAVARYDVFGMSGYIIQLSTEMGGMIAITRLDSGYPSVLTFALTPIDFGEEYWLRFELSDSLLGGKIWQGLPEDEPGSWTVSVVDGGYASPGSVGLFTLDENEGGSASVDVSFDEFEVSDEITLDFETATWGSLKRQYH